MPVNLENFGKDFGTELYVTLGGQKKVGDYNLSWGVSFEDLHPNLKFQGSDFFIFSGEVSREFKVNKEVSLSPFFRAEMSLTPNGDVGSDTFPKIGTRYAWKLTDNLTLTGKAMLMYDPGILGGDVAYVVSNETSLMWKLGDHLVLELPFVRVHQSAE
jgi:hypothetical protein